MIMFTGQAIVGAGAQKPVLGQISLIKLDLCFSEEKRLFGVLNFGWRNIPERSAITLVLESTKDCFSYTLGSMILITKLGN